MPTKDTLQIKDKMVVTLKNRGPSLPVHIAKEVGLSILFTSAFLSELFNDQEVKISHMRVGSSPIYYLSGQEPALENYAEYLKSKEKESFLLLKEKKFLKENELEPAIRVAIKEIKDFAIPFISNEEKWWRYFTIEESELKNSEEKIEYPKIKIEEEIQPEIEEISKTMIKEANELEEKRVTEEISQINNEGIMEPKQIYEKLIEGPEKEIKEEKLDIFEKESKKTIKRKIPVKRAKSNEKFLEKVKEFLSKSSVEILSIEGLKKEELILKVKIKGEEQLLVAYNKKKIGEKDILHAAKKASEFDLKYSILSLGELPKKISNLIDALQNIKNIGKVK